MHKVVHVHSVPLTMSVWDMSSKLTIASTMITVVEAMTTVISIEQAFAKKKDAKKDENIICAVEVWTMSAANT